MRRYSLGQALLLIFGGLALVVVVVLLLFLAAFTISFPATSRCQALIDALPEAKLAHPGAMLLNYQSQAGTRRVIEMSSLPKPGFIAHHAVPPDPDAVLRWYSEQLQALGWKPLTIEREGAPEPTLVGGGTYLQGRYRSERRPGEFIFLSVPETGPLAPPAPDGKNVLQVAYFITDPSSVRGCE